MTSEQKLREALQKLRSYNVSIAAGQINYRPEDHIAIIDKALQPSTSDEGTPTETPLTDTLFERHVDENRQSTPNAHRALRQVKELLEHARQLERTLHAKERELAATRRDADDWMQKYTYETMELDEVKAVQVAEAKKHDKVLCDIFARRVRVEETLLKMAAGKLPLPDAAKCRELAIVLGVPSEAQSVSAAPQDALAKAIQESMPDACDGFSKALNALPSGYVQVPREKRIEAAYVAANNYINALLTPSVSPQSLKKIADDYWAKGGEV